LLEELVEKLREKGVKITPQRLAVLKFLENGQKHYTAEEIYQAICKEYPAISLATIYNTLDMLVEINEVTKLKISDDNVVNYEYNNSEPHHHFYCKNCKKIVDIDIQCQIAQMKEYHGFMIDEVHGYFKGLCPECYKKVK
jgi:Fur family peroxide stress response transcriptional regulator